MQRYQLEHLLRAAGAITGKNRIVVVGSQAILGSYPNPPDELAVSVEADLYPLDDPNSADLIDGTIGEMSPFDEQFGYYAHGVGPETATLPRGWIDRAVRIANENTRGVEGICPCPVDLAVSKLAAGRPKDVEFVSSMLGHGMVQVPEIIDRIKELPPQSAQQVEDRLLGIKKVPR